MAINWLVLLCVALGGATGSVARFLLANWVNQLYGTLFPWGTFAVNFLGCILFGIIVAGLTRWFAHDYSKWLLLIGFLGGFTTFSTFAYETVSLLQAQRIGYALLNIGLSTGLCLLGLWLGLKVTNRIFL